MSIKQGIDKAIGKNTIRFFMPGHIGEKSISLHYDVTELSSTDNLRNPNGIIKHAQQNASVAFGALDTFFLVNGSSIGLHALILSVCKRGESLIVDRGCHISVINAMVLNDVRPIYVYPEYNREFGINLGINPKDISKAFEENPKAKGVLITSPTYYGICSDIRSIAEIAHRHNAPLIVDEAHGAHFVFSNNLPMPALHCGADGVVQSAHKTLPCITQGAMLHLGTDRIDNRVVQENINLLQTTSPSYLIMISIDEAILQMQKNGKENLERAINECNNLKEKLESTGKYKCLNCNDTTRLVINTGENAFDIQRKLKDEHNIEIEMCDGYNLVLIAKSCNKTSDFKRLKDALLSIAAELPAYKKAEIPFAPHAVLKQSPTSAYYSDSELLDIKNAVGRISARCIYKMPPCMSILGPGEEVTEEIANIINEKIYVTRRN